MINDQVIMEIGSMILRCEDVIEHNWDSLSFVFDLSDGHIANSGFIYIGNEVVPATAEIDSHPLLLDDQIIAFRKLVADQCGQNFKQLLVQMENNSKRIKIDFEFDDSSRWSITPSRLKEMREKLRPVFV
ncbi:hypothetical protein M3P05_20050 [Sansalvadorimonas sp. 2012CJ34-2]|uniref:DUF600 family protein n=1 Tax=Parendozoicomonas callyspongiae TaxID=2942213 RepID=A0ABT0PP43_9GAMM|nr:hypothetical protein [Sansalvadorimonas sp. 2012CJ34-2]MCL6272218.1 hypothetical protein [Sansalvadorimonas sp. 2012CJ34-2]